MESSRVCRYICRGENNRKKKKKKRTITYLSQLDPSFDFPIGTHLPGNYQSEIGPDGPLRRAWP